MSYAAGAVRLSALSKHQVIWVGEYIAELAKESDLHEAY